MSDHYQANRSGTHPEPAASSHGHRRRHRQIRTTPRRPPRGPPLAYDNVYSNHQNESGHSTSQVGLADNSYASPHTGETSTANTQSSSNVTVSSASTVGYQPDGMDRSNVAFGPSAYNHPFDSGTLPEEEDDVEAGAYAPPSANYHPYPPDNSFDLYSSSEQPPLYSLAPTSTSPAPYYPNSGYPAFASDSGVSYPFAQVSYTSTITANVEPMTPSPSSFGVWNPDNDMGEDNPPGQVPTMDVHCDRERAGSGDSGSSTQVYQGSIVYPPGQTAQGDTSEQYERQQARSDHEELSSDNIRGYMNNEDSWSTVNPHGFIESPNNDDMYQGEEDELTW
ncbi:hypothetical protein F4818DRAFT_437727 [Hypoxylon cercidicola]|nr:hypothetical protein F4818DRAFT_437727 [Hypoxylon cercidicola]